MARFAAVISCALLRALSAGFGFPALEVTFPLV